MTIGSSVPISDAQLATWLGVDPARLRSLAASGAVPAQTERARYLFDPIEVQEWLSSGQTGKAERVDARALSELTLLIQQGGEPDSLCRRALDGLLRALNAESAALLTADADAWLKPVAFKGHNGSRRVEVAESIAAWVAISGRPLLLHDVSRAGIGNLDRDPELARDTLAAPILLEGHAFGVVVLTRGLDGDPFCDEDLALTTAAATQLGLAIKHSHMKSALDRATADSELAQRQLESFALDVRSTFAEEKRRAEELARALEELQQTYLATVKGLAVAVEAKDEYTAGHLNRVTRYGLAMMRIIAPGLADDRQFEYGFLLHDVGKLGVPDAILKKEGPLTDEEWAVMRNHAEIGLRILKDIPFLAGACEIVYAHHERWDGKGYPRGLEGDEIPLGARVFPIADSFDAMRSNRPYRKALPLDVALEEIRKGSGTQFWPVAVEAFLSLPIDELEAISRDAVGTEVG